VYRSVVKANAKTGIQDIAVKLYVPASRIFCASQGIPFHITLESNTFSLAAFSPHGPTTDPSRKLCATRLRLMRQSAVDVRRTTTEGTNASIWRIDYIGEAAFRRVSERPTCVSFSGEIAIEPIKVMGFNIPGLSVQDCIILTVTPPEGTKTPAFVGIREIIPIRLTTDSWTEDDRGIAVARRSLSVSLSRGAV